MSLHCQENLNVLFYIAVDCGLAPGLENGKLVDDSVKTTTFGSTAQYQCDDNYELVDRNTTRTCLASGKWSNTVRCGELAVFVFCFIS